MEKMALKKLLQEERRAPIRTHEKLPACFGFLPNRGSEKCGSCMIEESCLARKLDGM